MDLSRSFNRRLPSDVRRRARGGSRRVASPAVVQVPESIADLAAWWHTRYGSDPSSPTDITLNSGNVSLWVPRAEDAAIDYDLLQGTASLQPLYDSTSGGNLGGEPSVGSSGDYLLQSAAMRDLWHSGATDWTFFVVARFPVSGTTLRFFLTNALATASGIGFELVRTNAGNVGARLANGSGAYVFDVETTGGLFAGVDRWFCVRTRFGADLRIDYSGGQVIDNTPTGSPTASAALGTAFVRDGYKVPYMLLYRRALEDAEVAALAADVATGGANDYGVTA